MKFALLNYGQEANEPMYRDGATIDMMAPWHAFNEELVAAGKLLGGEALGVISTATSVQVRDGKTITFDGPFAETKETLGGFYIIEADSLEEAIEWAAKIPTATHGTIEIRPVAEFG